jgi:four helix bundle protein
MTKENQKFDLLERTEKFGKNVINFAKLIPKNIITLPLISQFIRSGTSIGANYHEADNAESKNDFKHKIGISKKESQETEYWLKMIVVACPELKEKALILYQEAKELKLIFNAITRSCSI